MVKIKLLLGILLLNTSVGLFGIVGLMTQTASAADAGCYAISASVGSDNQVTQNTTATDCPSELQDGVNSGKCFTTTVSSGGQSSFTEKDCSQIEIGSSGIGESTASETDNGEDTLDVKVNINGYNSELDGEYYCGKGPNQVKISFDIGCLGNAYSGAEYNPILDMMFALLRFVSAGVGLVVVGSIVWAGIQYSASRGDSKGTEAAIKRVTNSVIALLIYIFSFAILNFLVPGGLFV